MKIDMRQATWVMRQATWVMRHASCVMRHAVLAVSPLRPFVPSSPRPLPSSQSGFALPLTLAMTTALLIASTGFFIHSDLSVERSLAVRQQVEARSLLRTLAAQMADQPPAALTALADRPGAAEIGGYRVEWEIAVENGRLNVSRLTDLILGEDTQKLFEALLDKEQFERRAWQCAVDWQDADDERQPFGAERLDYVGHDAAPRNAPFETLDELAFVLGFQDESAMERVRTDLTVKGGGKLYPPALSDRMLDVLEKIYGFQFRRDIESFRRDVDKMSEYSGGDNPKYKKIADAILTSAPDAWTVRLKISTEGYARQARFVISRADSASSVQWLE